MALKTGQPAPDFTLFSSKKEPWTLSDHRGENVLILFFPAAFTGGCTDEMATVSNDLDSYHGAQIVGISTDSPFTLGEFGKVNGIAFTLLSDHNAEVAEAYSAKYNNNFTDMKLDRIAKRSAFVVDREGVIQYIEVLGNAGDQPDFNAIKSVLADLG